MFNSSLRGTLSFARWISLSLFCLLACSATQAADSASRGKEATKVEALTELSKVFRKVAADLKPGVFHVSVEGGSMSKEDITSYMQRYGDPFDFFGNAYLKSSLERTELPPGSGSGIAWTKTGHILTCYHVIANRTKIVVTDSEEKEFPATLLAGDPASDIAILKIDSATTPLKLGESKDLKTGDWVVTLGAPFGLTQTMTHGIVSALARSGVEGVSSRYQNFIQTDAAVHPGNSGGVLANLDGEVVGIVNAAAPASQAMTAGIGFAIPIDSASKIAGDLIERQEVVRPWIGIMGTDFKKEWVEQMSAGENGGLLINNIIVGETADQAGLLPGDLIVRLNLARVRSSLDVSNLIAPLAIGTKVQIEYYRDGKRLTTEAVLTEWKADLTKLSLSKGRKFEELKCSVVNTSSDVVKFNYEGGGPEATRSTEFSVLVTDIDSGAEMAKGDIITMIEGQAIRSIPELAKALEKLPKNHENIEVTFTRKGESQTVKISPLKPQSAPDSATEKSE